MSDLLYIGMIVHYVRPNTDGHCAAIVTRIVDRDAWIVHLHVFPTDVLQGALPEEDRLDVPYSRGKSPNTWHRVED